MKKISYPLLILTSIFLLTGCVAGGTKFTKVEVVPQDKALIYFYRPSTFQGSAIAITVKDNNKAVFKIQNAQYIKYLAEPGIHEFHTDTMAIDKPTKLEVEAGKTYFIKTNLRVGMWAGTWALNRVYDNEALEELQACCKSGKE